MPTSTCSSVPLTVSHCSMRGGGDEAGPAVGTKRAHLEPLCSVTILEEDRDMRCLKQEVRRANVEEAEEVEAEEDSAAAAVEECAAAAEHTDGTHRWRARPRLAVPTALA